MSNRTCLVPGCAKPFYGLGKCQAHYARQRLADPRMGTCTVDGCTRGSVLKSYGWRGMHYARWRNRGALELASASERFWAMVAEAGDCWCWTGSLSGSGYGKFWLNGRSIMAHRFSYEQLIDDIPAGLTIDHLCRNTICVNPWRLEPVPGVVNTRRASAYRRKTHCHKGHEFTNENTLVNNQGHQFCRTCRRAREKARRVKSREILR
jgi:hypothetical protein